MSRLAIEKVQKRDHNIKKLREKYDVKSMVIEYEHVLSQVNGYVKKNMGADQSAVRPIPNNNNNGLVKQRIEKFNQIEQDLKIKTRSVSTYNNAPKSSTEFQRSKSVDPSRRQNRKKLTENSNGFHYDTKSLPRKSSRKQDKKNSTVEEPLRKTATSSVYLKNINDNVLTTKTAQNEHQKTDSQLENHLIDEFSDNHVESGAVDKEFEIIESQMQDAANTILEMTENQTNSVFISSIENFVITNNKHNTNVLDDGHRPNDVENIQSVDIYLTDHSTNENNFEQLRQKNINYSESENKASLLNRNKDGSIENLDIYLTDRTSIGENQFGEICKDNLKDLDFVEAYNQTGYELLMTTVHSVTQLDDQEITPENKSENNQEQNDDIDKTCIGIDNALYFSKEELETLIPDDDSESTFETVKQEKSVEDEFIEKLESAGAITVQKKFSDTIKSETTIYDSFQNPRIAKVRSITKREEFSKENILKDDDDSSKNVESKPKIEYIVEEIVATEKTYIDHLERVLEDYMPYFKSNKLAPKTTIRTVFGNIKDIYALTQKLYRTLKSCPNYEAVAKTFVRYEPLFDMYPLYLKTNPPPINTYSESLKISLLFENEN
ncbi:hypothetical protein FQR65_LT11443 [Abscondita terminalis]|nr:hypothetical protein FQR65_LT11443 [Abscondita terminalis]